jgi:hypothetical protein
MATANAATDTPSAIYDTKFADIFFSIMSFSPFWVFVLEFM